MKFSLARRLCAEFLGTAFLLMAVVGSGVRGVRLLGGNAAIALLANSIATGAALVTLIYTLASVSGAHFNPIGCSACQPSHGRATARSGPAQFYAEVVATLRTDRCHFGRFAASASCNSAVGRNIYRWRLFANPAVTVARPITDTFAGIRPPDIPAFVLAQILGASVAFFVFRWMISSPISAESAACQ
jgi:glycerol uptake facilitator-like aquaporin